MYSWVLPWPTFDLKSRKKIWKITQVERTLPTSHRSAFLSHTWLELKQRKDNGWTVNHPGILNQGHAEIHQTPLIVGMDEVVPIYEQKSEYSNSKHVERCWEMLPVCHVFLFHRRLSCNCYQPGKFCWWNPWSSRFDLVTPIRLIKEIDRNRTTWG